MIKYEKDSRLVKPGQTFVAIKGFTVDGHEYVDQAIKNGAKNIIAERELSVDIPVTIVANSEKYLEEKLEEEYSSELKNMHFIGVTGTNGKTTTCYIIYQMLQSLNVNVAYIGTLGFYTKNTFIELNNTTPDILTLYKLLFRAKEEGCTHIIMEVSSHAISYNRIAGLDFESGGFTNLTQDHLDYHITMENYFNEKLKLLNYLKKGAPFITNSDDEKGLVFKEKYDNTYSIGLGGDYKILNYQIKPDKTDLVFSFNNKEYKTSYELTNKFNIYNYLMALAIINQLGYKIEDIINISEHIRAPKGRSETIKVNKGFAVVDYAHAPDAVEKVITAYNEIKENRIITVLGCGGDRDPKKRPIMGAFASNLSDYVIFTNDNPRTEDPKLIMKDILEGVTKDNYEIIYDRKDAIKKAIDIMEDKDIVLLLGKGHENYQIIGREKIHLDDAEEVINWSK